MYDITDFIPKHPGGGEKIMMAAGGSADPFWMIYGVHRNADVLNLLEEHRIGTTFFLFPLKNSKHFLYNLKSNRQSV